MDDLARWLGVQLDEDTRLFTDPHSDRSWHAKTCESLPDVLYPDREPGACDCGVPERMRREIAAKRILVAEHDREWCPHCMDDPNGCPTRRAWVLPYNDRPGFREEWRP